MALVLAAYVAGHLLELVSRLLRADVEYPSKLELTSGQSSMPRVLSLVRAQGKDEFGLEPEDDRSAFFLLCRDSIRAAGAPGYGEQFQALAALMRGFAAAFAVAALAYLGLALEQLTNRNWRWAGGVSLWVVGAAGFWTWTRQDGAKRDSERRRWMIQRAVVPLLTGLIPLVGFYEGWRLAPVRNAPLVLGIAALVFVALSILCRFRGQEWDADFAKSVLRAFVAMRSRAPDSKAGVAPSNPVVPG